MAILTGMVFGFKNEYIRFILFSLFMAIAAHHFPVLALQRKSGLIVVEPDIVPALLRVTGGAIPSGIKRAALFGEYPYGNLALHARYDKTKG